MNPNSTERAGTKTGPTVRMGRPPPLDGRPVAGSLLGAARLGVGISLRWLQLALTWLLTPSDDAVERAKKLNDKRALREARRGYRG